MPLTPEPALPRRHSGLWLPALGEKVFDQPQWRTQPGPGGDARLRVWQTADGGFFAVVTEPGSWRSAVRLVAAEDSWHLLSERYGEPFGLAELWSADGSVDLVLPPRYGRLGWLQVQPARPGHSLAAALAAWWTVNGADILAP
jgi:hypothetical protein